MRFSVGLIRSGWGRLDEGHTMTKYSLSSQKHTQAHKRKSSSFQDSVKLSQVHTLRWILTCSSPYLLMSRMRSFIFFISSRWQRASLSEETLNTSHMGAKVLGKMYRSINDTARSKLSSFKMKCHTLVTREVLPSIRSILTCIFAHTIQMFQHYDTTTTARGHTIWLRKQLRKKNNSIKPILIELSNLRRHFESNLDFTFKNVSSSVLWGMWTEHWNRILITVRLPKTFILSCQKHVCVYAGLSSFSQEQFN